MFVRAALIALKRLEAGHRFWQTLARFFSRDSADAALIVRTARKSSAATLHTMGRLEELSQGRGLFSGFGTHQCELRAGARRDDGARAGGAAFRHLWARPLAWNHQEEEL
eukprot:1909457-Pleurochrysis_carterae.AAC.1